MKGMLEFETAETATLVPTLPSTSAVRTQTLIKSLRSAVAALEAEITAEEERLQKFDPTDVAYPWIAKVGAERCHNLRVTIASLEERFGSMLAA